MMKKKGPTTKLIIFIAVLIVGGILLLALNYEPNSREPDVKKHNLSSCGESGEGVWIEEQIGGYLDLNVNSDEGCQRWGGNCGDPRIISSFIIGICSDGKDCWRPDVWEPTCLLPN